MQHVFGLANKSFTKLCSHFVRIYSVAEGNVANRHLNLTLPKHPKLEIHCAPMPSSTDWLIHFCIQMFEQPYKH